MKKTVDQRVVPRGVHHAKISIFEKKRQCCHPSQEFGELVGGVGRIFIQRSAVLRMVRVGVAAQPAARLVASMPRQRIVFVISRHHRGASGLNHPAHDSDGVSYTRSPIDEVSDKDRPPPRVRKTPRSATVSIAEAAQKSLKCVGMPVNIADNVVHSCNWIKAGKEFQW